MGVWYEWENECGVWGKDPHLSSNKPVPIIQDFHLQTIKHKINMCKHCSFEILFPAFVSPTLANISIEIIENGTTTLLEKLITTPTEATTRSDNGSVTINDTDPGYGNLDVGYGILGFLVVILFISLVVVSMLLYLSRQVIIILVFSYLKRNLVELPYQRIHFILAYGLVIKSVYVIENMQTMSLKMLLYNNSM